MLKAYSLTLFHFLSRETEGSASDNQSRFPPCEVSRSGNDTKPSRLHKFAGENGFTYVNKKFLRTGDKKPDELNLADIVW